MLPKINEDDNYKTIANNQNNQNNLTYNSINDKNSLKSKDQDFRPKKSIKLIDKKIWFKDKNICQSGSKPES